ncbi:hypothetical protein [Pseudanabaena sp. Chao 1811]|uniref:hypothetical protein n=1 Tax=Pseudanabaena sp. Chao 1811 TaxID=2963092 RepID=UPI0022F3F732|nr:hypothetical protein [Pseudanabaena sp. Chao 1811]
MMRLLLYLCLWIGSMGLAIFSSQNIYAVTVKLGAFESIKLPLGLVLIFCAGLGSVAMTLLMGFTEKSIQFSFPSIPKFTKISSKKTQTESQKTSSNKRSANSFNKKKQESRDSFDDDWDDEWD